MIMKARMTKAAAGAVLASTMRVNLLRAAKPLKANAAVE